MKIKEQSLALCYAIEAAGASEALTKCSVLASELHAEAKRIAAGTYPPNERGQRDFAGMMLECHAEELAQPEAAPAVAAKATQ